MQACLGLIYMLPLSIQTLPSMRGPHCLPATPSHSPFLFIFLPLSLPPPLPPPPSQVEVGSLELSCAPFSVVEELETLLDMFAVHCIGSGVDLSMDVSDDMPEAVMGDAMRFRQIVSNLLSNSVKFTESGHVRIRAWVARSRVSATVSH